MYSKYLNQGSIVAGGGSGGSGVITITEQPAWVTIGPVDNLDYDKIFDQIAKRFNKVPTVEHKCHNCGGTLEIKANDGIFKCPYCKSCYAVGTNRVNWKY